MWSSTLLNLWRDGRFYTLGLTTTVEWVAMWRLNCPPFSETSTFFTPGGGRSSKDCMSRPRTMDNKGIAMMIPGHDRRPAPNGRNRKSLPDASILPSRKRSGLNFSGSSQCLGLLAIHHEFTNTWLNERGESTASYRSIGWVWEVSGWVSRFSRKFTNHNRRIYWICAWHRPEMKKKLERSWQ